MAEEVARSGRQHTARRSEWLLRVVEGERERESKERWNMRIAIERMRKKTVSSWNWNEQRIEELQGSIELGRKNGVWFRLGVSLSLLDSMILLPPDFSSFQVGPIKL